MYIFAIDLHIVSEHEKFLVFDIIDNVLVKVLAKMDCYSSYTWDGLEYFFDACFFETILQI